MAQGYKFAKHNGEWAVSFYGDKERAERQMKNIDENGSTEIQVEKRNGEISSPRIDGYLSKKSYSNGCVAVIFFIAKRRVVSAAASDSAPAHRPAKRRQRVHGHEHCDCGNWSGPGSRCLH